MRYITLQQKNVIVKEQPQPMANATPLAHNLNFSMLPQRSVNVQMAKYCCQLTNVEFALQTLFTTLPPKIVLPVKTPKK
jgi:hypothetical protein